MIPSLDELRKLPLTKLRSLDIRNGEEERLVQAVVNEKVKAEPVVKPVHIRVPDIRTKEEEIYWQKKVDEAKEASRPKPIDEGGYVSDVSTDELSAENIDQTVQVFASEEPPAEHPQELQGKPCCGSLGFRHKKNCPTKQ